MAFVLFSKQQVPHLTWTNNNQNDQTLIFADK